MVDPVEIHPFSWEDLENFTHLANAVKGLKNSLRAHDVPSTGAWLSQPGLDPLKNCMVARNRYGLIGYVLVTPETLIQRAVLEGGVNPQHQYRDVRSQLLTWGVAKAQDLGATVAHMASSEEDHNTRLFLQSHHFSHVRHYWQMRCETRTIPDPDYPNDVRIRSFEAGDDTALAEVQNAAFGGQWGFCPNTPEEIGYRVRMGGASPEDVLFLLRASQVAGYCWTRIDGPPGDSIGVISMIGVHPEHRGSGMGRRILLEGMEYLWDRGVQAVELEVDSVNTAARELYLSVGYHKVGGIMWYEQSLPGH